MKTDPRGTSPSTARTTPDAHEAAVPIKPRLRRAVVFLAALIIIASFALVGRHAIVGFVLSRGLAAITGDRIAIRSFVLGSKQGVFSGVNVSTPDGDPLLTVDRIAIRYSLRELIGGVHHRFGLTSVALDRPTFTVVRHADGSYNLRTGTADGGGRPAAAQTVPLAFGVRVRAGEIRLLDRAPSSDDLREQTIGAIEIDGQIASDRQTRARGRAILHGRRTAGAGVASWPLALSALSDAPRGIAIVRAHAPLLPLRGLLGFLTHSSAVRIDDGVLHDLDVKLFALNWGLDELAAFHVGGGASVDGGRLTVAALRRPVRDLRGRLTLTDDGVWTGHLAGMLGGIPLTARGGAFNRAHPVLRLGVGAHGDLEAMRSIFAFSALAPVKGPVRVETLIEAPVSNLLIRSAVNVDHGAYAGVPLTNIAGRVDYHAATVVLDAVRARYGASDVDIGGRFLLGSTLRSAIAIAARGPGRALPYAENLAPEARVDALAVISGGDGYRARGAIGLRGAGLTGRATFAVDSKGVGEFGPFAFERPDGSSLVGALRLERPTSQSAAWLSARHYRVAVPATAARLPGLSIPAFPPIAGTFDASIAGGGTPGNFGLAGSLRGSDLRAGNAGLGAGHARISGTLRDVRLSALALDGALGRFRGDAAVLGGTFSLRGVYDGALDRLVPLTGKQLAYGAVHGSVLATLNGRDVVVQSSGAALHAASIRGVDIERVAGTLALRQNALHVLAADGSIGGRRAVAREWQNTVAISAPDLPASALRGTGLPLEAGNLSIFGVADLRRAAPSFDGTVAVADGRSRGYHLSGDAQIDLDKTRARIFAATGALGSTFGAIDGSIDGIGERALRYDLDTRVPLGDIGLLRGDLGLPVRHLAGSFAAKLHVRGSGNVPLVDGTVEAPEGSYNGLAFRAAAARLRFDAHGIAARDGRLTVGSTHATISASTGGGGFSVAASAGHIDLADFNDFFDAGETLAGRGTLELAFRTGRTAASSTGRIDLQDTRVRNLPLGNVTADWHMDGTAIAGEAKIASTAGRLEAVARIAPAREAQPLAAFRDATFDVHATLQRIDLGTWLPATGLSTPVLGKVDARLRVAGRVPRLALGVDAALDDATIAGIHVRAGRLQATSAGTRITVTSSSADFGFATVTGSGMLGARPDDPLAFDLRATTNDISGAIHTFVPASRRLDFAGVLATDVRFAGSVAQPRIEGGFDLTNARYGTFAVPRAIGALALAGRAIELRDADVEFTRGQAFVAGSLPLALQPFTIGPARAPLSFDVTARAVDLAQFGPLLPAGTKLGGTIDGRFGVEGTVDRPRLLGALAVADGSYLSPLERAPIQHFDARLAFAGSRVALQTFHAAVGTGTLDAGGSISLPFGANPRTSYALDVRAKAAQLDFPAYGRGIFDGTLHVTGGPGQPLVAGNLALRDAVIPVAAVYGSTPAAGPAGGGGGLAINPAFDLHAAVGNNVRIRSSIVDIGVTGAVDVTGSFQAPKLAGAFTATDGTVSTYNHIFRVVNASAKFDPADGILPTIAARASARVTDPDPDPSRNIAGSANIIVSVDGTPDSNNLQVTYSSDPPYSQEQIVGLLLDVPALLGALNFNLNSGPGATLLRGAPGETNALLPPGVTPEQVSAISFNQEVFSILNGQFTQRALNPVERVFEKIFGLSDLEFTVDYGGGLGYSLRRQIGKRDFYAFLSQTVTYPERSNFGFELEPKPYETINFSYYQQNGVTSLITNQTPGAPFLSGATRRLTSVQPLGNRSGFSLDFNRRF